MPRRKVAKRRELPQDAVYQSRIVTKFINIMMVDGKRSTASQSFYRAMEEISRRTPSQPMSVFQKAIENVKPMLETKSRRVGGANYQVPVEVRPERRTTLAVRWLIEYARDRKGNAFHLKLADELIDASNNQGGAVKKREDTHKMAEANKAFAHYKW